METRPYYSARKRPQVLNLDLPTFKRLFHAIYFEFYRKEYFQEAFGYGCVDEGEVHGIVGSDIEAFLLRKLRKPDLWPLSDKLADYSEEDLFDIIELLHDLISKPLTGTYHSWNQCGWHYSTFDRDAGQHEFRSELNQILSDYRSGFELSEQGEILEKADPGLDYLFEVKLPPSDPNNIEGRVYAAIVKFRRHHASLDDRRDAVRSLADVLEFLRPRLQNILTKKDDADLFNIANNFGIRHHNDKQKNKYEHAIWLSWMFYYYLATIHSVTRLLKASSEK